MPVLHESGCYTCKATSEYQLPLSWIWRVASNSIFSEEWTVYLLCPVIMFSPSVNVAFFYDFFTPVKYLQCVNAIKKILYAVKISMAV